jgi:hypothetical protein
MNDRNDRQAKLLAETFHDAWETGPAAEFAREAAAAARRRHVARRSLRAAGALALIAAAVFFSQQKPRPSPLPRTETQKSVTQGRGYEIMSDEELLTQVRDQPLLVVKKADGTRQIIALEKESE